MKNRYIPFITAILSSLLFMSCGNFLDRDPDRIMTNDQVFSDEVMTRSVLANFYGRLDGTGWGQRTNNGYSMTILDDAALCQGSPDTKQGFSDTQWRLYDYTLVRDFNRFLVGVRETDKLSASDKKLYEGEVRFLRAWYYFTMARGLGGMPLIGDKVFDYTPGMDITALQTPRSTEAGIYDYIISECTAIADMLPETMTTNSARVNKWTALMLKARAAVYAGSLANYNNKMVQPVRTAGGEVGISPDLAEGYYKTALSTAKDVIRESPYKIMMPGASADMENMQKNYYNATSVKENNTEVIWAKDYKYPGTTVGFTKFNLPHSVAEDEDNSYGGPVLNLVEAFEFRNDRDGRLHIGTIGNPVFYDTPEALFKDKDARLWGSVIYPDAVFKNEKILLQAGQLIKKDGKWSTLTGILASTDENDLLITSENGPRDDNNVYVNKTGFYYRKLMDETPQSATRGRGSEMWYPHFRISEAYLIAAEASFELNGSNAEALEYINTVRRRGGIQDLTSMTFDDIVNENRVEFCFEDHRFWDLKRWRLADKIWNGVSGDANAQLWALYPYRVNAPGDAHDKQWVYIKQKVYTEPYPLNFLTKNYYNFIDLNWRNNNPKLVLNPYQ